MSEENRFHWRHSFPYHKSQSGIENVFGVNYSNLDGLDSLQTHMYFGVNFFPSSTLPRSSLFSSDFQIWGSVSSLLESSLSRNPSLHHIWNLIGETYGMLLGAYFFCFCFYAHIYHSYFRQMKFVCLFFWFFSLSFSCRLNSEGVILCELSATKLSVPRLWILFRPISTTHFFARFAVVQRLI